MAMATSTAAPLGGCRGVVVGHVTGMLKKVPPLVTAPRTRTRSEPVGKSKMM
jgi:hypothetical protein